MRLIFSLHLAWRNIWRQKRRTLITAAAIAMAMFLALFMRSMQEGSYAHNLDNATRFFSGYLQIQQKGFSENRSIDLLLPGGDGFRDKIHTIEGIRFVVPRLESFALAAAGDKSKGVLVLGVDPRAEDAYSGLSDRVKQGDYLHEDQSKGVLIGGRMARYFNLALGDELVLYGQGYHGATAAGLYTVRGILQYPNAQMDAGIVYLPLHTAQKLYDTGNQVTSWVLHGDDARGIPKLATSAREVMGGSVDVRTWDQISPELAQQISLDRVSGQFMVLVLYIVVGFSLLATIVMMTLERQREFAVMMAAGMVRIRLQFLVVVEALFLSMVGVVMGLSLVLPVLLWFHKHPILLTGEIAVTMEEMGYDPIIPFSLEPRLFVMQVLMVLCLLALCVVYPLVRVGRMSLADALKG